MPISYAKMAYLAWGVFFLYWLISGLRSRAHNERQEPIASRLVYLGLLGSAISLIAFDPWIYGPLLRRFVPESAYVNIIGLAVLMLGLGIAVWARVCLGRYWSARVSLTDDHALIRTGPYRWVRNPIYLGGLIGMIGTAIVIGEIRAIPATGLALLAFL